MNYEELLIQKNALTAQLNQIDQEIAEYYHKKFHNNLDVAITALKNMNEIEPYETITVEYECESCGRYHNLDVDLSDLIQELNYMKERYSK